MRILSLTNEEINDHVKEMESGIKQLKHELYKICWYMRGSVSIEASLHLSQEDREIISKIIEDNLEITKKTGISFF
jgi:ribosomal protein L9